jgi:SAM-dependent methyltransferase
VSWTYGDVDHSADPLAAVRWTDTMASWPSVQAYKRRTRELLAATAPRPRPAPEATDRARVLDVGCGTGEDTRALPGRSVGLDASAAMIGEAARRGGDFVRGDAHALPFRDGTFDGCRADRTLQHLVHPERALAELARVTRPGGRVVVVDPDQETIVVEGADPAVVRRVKQFRCDDGLRHGDLAHRLPRLFRAAGLVDVAIEGTTLVLTDPDDAFGFPTWARAMHDRGLLDAPDVERFEAGVRASSDAGDFLYAVTYFITSGRTP